MTGVFVPKTCEHGSFPLQPWQCTKKPTHRHQCIDDTYMFICEEHACPRCMPLEKPK